MTSPTQLKYLDAMGIPVWVSRDLVTLVKTHSDNSTLNSDDISHSSAINSAVKQENTQLNTDANSAQKILDSLHEKNTDASTKTNIESDSSDSIAKIKIKIDTDSNPSVSLTTHDIEASSQNLLFKSAQYYIFANGNENAEWLIIGHSPEPYTGIGQEPFASEAGELINKMLHAISIPNPRQQAYMVNVLDINHDKSASLDTDPNANLYQELSKIIKEIKPKIVLIVGQKAAQNLLKIDEPLVIMRSKVHQLTELKIPCVVTYYPSYLLQKPIDKRKAWNDLKLAMSALTDVS